MLQSDDEVFVLDNSIHRSQAKIESPIKFSRLIGLGVKASFTIDSSTDFVDLKSWMDDANDIIFGYFSYDLKNRLENLKSRHPDSVGFPHAHFVIPETVVVVNDERIQCLTYSENLNILTSSCSKKAHVSSDFHTKSQENYVATVKALKTHIQQGDIYEANYCIEHMLADTEIIPHQLYQELQHSSPAPFSCYVADNGKYLMSSSPERFIMKIGRKIISQPMKGTNRRTADNEEQKRRLRNDPKEVTENVMITDLVRNDLSRSAKKGTVRVDELCAVSEFKHVNTMISTLSAELRDDIHPLDALLNAFPMGSMTGAPKIRAMELIDEYEDFSRGLYSGAVGYFTPDLDFDFNVVIRSVLYNEEKKLVTFPTGGAITINSDPEKEYEECMLKAEAMRKVLMNHARKS